MKRTVRNIVAMLFGMLCSQQDIAQLTISGELRPRTEFRDGVGTLKLKANSSSFFISQRSRITFNCKTHHVVFQTSIQDVRVWGQDASTISSTDGNKLELHEGWAEVFLADKKDSSFKQSAVDYFSIKIGRQELNYDKQRLLGGLDWLQQARTHDAVVFKLANGGWQFDLGAAFNQNTDAFNYDGTYYTPANVMPYVKDSKGNLAPTPIHFIPLSNSSGWSSKYGTPSLQNAPSTNGLYQNYKALRFLHVTKTFHETKLAALALLDQFGKYVNDSVRNISGSDTGYIYGKRFNQKGINSRVTAGFFLTSSLGKRKDFELNAEFYYQGGKDRDGEKLNALLSGLSMAWSRKKFTYTVGWDYLSGNDAYSSSATNHRFDPLYGTPHKFWGYMDYFYVGTGSPSGGLSSGYAKARFTALNERFNAELDYHYFSLARDQKNVEGKAIGKYLGSEFDLVANYQLNKITDLQYGFCVMAASGSMEYAKNISPGTANLTGVFSYLMITIKPAFLFK